MKQAIIDTAITLLEKYGIKFTLDDIATANRISKKTIYKYFRSKDALINALIDFIFEDIHRQQQLIMQEDIPEVEKLKRIVCVYPQAIHLDSIQLDKMVDLYPNAYARIVEQLSTNWDLTLELYDQCVADGSLRDIGREYFRLIVLGVFEQAIHMEDSEKVTRECIDILFSGFINDCRKGSDAS